MILAYRKPLFVIHENLILGCLSWRSSRWSLDEFKEFEDEVEVEAEDKVEDEIEGEVDQVEDVEVKVHKVKAEVERV